MQSALKTSSRPDPAVDRDWWRGAVIYQIYPRSYQDSNGDGIGDLQGIVRRLPYIASLGVDAIWISPFFKSPMKDFGYDVSDYCDVDPMFGTLADFDALVAEAHRLGLKVMIDEVLSHTADIHPWFKESRSSRTNPKADWYVWADAKPDGTPPNNWLSIFGGSAWQWDTSRQQYYMHNFLAEQPDLNFHNAEVQDALLNITRFWLERGVDGFRLDTINFYFHSLGLEDNPPLPPEERNDQTAPAVNPYNYQDHIYDKSRPENLGFLERFRALLDEYPAQAAVGEVGDSQRGLEVVAAYTADGKRVHMCYSFDFLAPEKISAAKVRAVLEAFGRVARDGWSCWAFSNHDVMRVASRWAANEADPSAYLKVISALLMSLRGSVCIYQGEELGLGEAELKFEDLQDPYGIRFWPEFKGRDGCRTPMVWDAAVKNGGFSTAKPWLPVPGKHLAQAVNVQQGDPSSLLEHYRRFLAFRRQHSALGKGEIDFIESDGDTVAFTRREGNERIACVFNLASKPAEVDLGKGSLQPLPGHGFSGQGGTGPIRLGGYGAWFGRID
ncbi:alpha-glucosidase [Mesorhizobium sp. M1A.F.Ca.IN.020.06.1.1]|uniref:beta-galactosidase BglA n=7 Tax=Mesorhizobium TaxID=68287 RepID=UPI000BB06DC2|nr:MULTISPECIES: alpha-glucosidase family protein [unclassified Mesorhizobium]PBB33626.1 alpha-glucosidase [Mesorhizobium sp. WSM3882]RUU94589.1 alpha-glucosidase [Mesorhizobium sp. M1A.F.Ca.IN.020.03.2.1]RUW08707.1 alpha-glucosidase [Mesorhizobium sp. M1A.F.Ca.IN.022.05.2.1]RUW35749.1 alpha-glucosidase [Mesorhizobium sp. M1A.F.Ca.IN.020.06.1.1]RWH00920.1 MAG: alpha-glucosidase [Mesorhizobium sp.]